MARKEKTAKQQVKELEPAAYSQTMWEITGHRTYYVCLGSRTLAKGMSPNHVWRRALDILHAERKEVVLWDGK